MIKKLIDFALDQRVVTLALAVVFIAYGWYAYRELPVEAFPDPDDPHVQVITLWPGQAAEDVEAQVTLPAEQQLNSTPRLTSIRSTSMFGLSVVTLTFEDDVDDNIIRAQVLERMQGVTLPPGAQWQLGALTTSTGEVYRYVIRDSRHKLEDIRAVQDWVIEPALRQVPGVGDVNAFGGGIKQFQVFVKPELLSEHRVTLQQVFQALQNNNLNIGGNVLKTGEQSLVVRGVGVLTGVDDIRNVVVANYNGHPIYVYNVADVRTGMAPRQGIASYHRKDANGATDQIDDVVETIVLNRKGTNALRVIEGIKQKIAYLNKNVLPTRLPGARIVPIYDRTDLVDQTLHTVMHNLIFGAILIFIICFIFTGNLRAAVVIWLVIPLALLAAFITLHFRGVAANLLSFGAVDFGILVDAAVVIVEAILVRQALSPPSTDFRELVRKTSEGLGRPMLFAKLILIVSLIPIFTFQRVEGRIFRPMALTIAGAIIGATLVTFTLVPLAASALLKSRRPTHENALTTWLKVGYGRLLRVALNYKPVTIGVAVSVLGMSLYVGAHLGTEFLPKLDEGNIWMDVTMPLSISPDTAKEDERRIRAVLASFPESRLIFGQLGRPDDGTDTKGWNHLEVGVYLPPHDQWVTKGPDGKVVDKNGLIALMNQKLQELPGLDFNFSQYIEDNVEEALSGVQGELAIKLFGDDLKVLQAKGEEIRKVLSQVPGNADLEVEQLSGQPNLTIAPKPDAIARYGLDKQTVLSLVETGLGGKVAGSLLEGQMRFDIAVRLDQPARSAVGRIGDLWVDTPSGQRIPLATLADIKLETGAARIQRDENRRRIAIKCSIRGRDMGSFVADAQQRVAQAVAIPEGYNITWEGQFENQRRANARLKFIIPLSLLLIVVLLYWAFKRLRYAMLIMVNVPFVLIGALAMLFATHTNLSVSAMIGFIALAGVSVLNGTVLVAQFNQLRAHGMPLHEAVIQGAQTRIRPVLMTALMAAIGMYPMAISRGIGSEVQRPLALVILGGMLSAVLLMLVVLPVLYELFEYYFPAEVTVPEGLVD
ncbi:MAG TPA: CusA/CzcA family heavy metal efflux RND transporter [Tepidisphaeraceae bacterium]|nr:CusA/CzcA family heavy metal efflux RND transporter [Tepidisphaeraceae bacterium]